MAQSSSSSAQSSPQISFAKEVGNAYAQMICKNNVENQITCFVNDQGVDETPRKFLNGDPKNGHSLDMAYRVRIPALMFIKSTPNALDEDVTKFMEDKSRCRRQFGTHLFVQSTIVGKTQRQCLVHKHTSWSELTKGKDPKREYKAYSANPTLSVYPCCKTDSKGNLRMILGLCFADPYKNRQNQGDQSSKGKTPQSHGLRYQRMFGRQHVTTQAVTKGIYPLPNRYSFDIEEDFIDINRGSDEINFKNLELFNLEDKTKWVAIYVCRGAKLMVRDNWYGTNEKGEVQNIPAGQPGNHCRSLFQQGSLVAVAAELNSITLNVIREKTPGAKNVFGLPYDWSINHFVTNTQSKNADPKQYVDSPVKDLDATEKRIEGKVPDFTTNRYKVLFLGAVESQYNSVCWSLDITRSNSDNPHHLNLYWPEGGTLQDYSSWRTGFFQIYYRHRYERLFESVLISEGVPLPTNLPFQVPPKHDKDQQGHYFFRRILGYPDGNRFDNRMMKLHPSLYSDLKIPEDFKNDCQYDRDVRRYIASDETIAINRRCIQFIMDKPSIPAFLKWPALIPPLYPPIKENEGKVYLDKTDKVVSVKKTGPDSKYGTYFQILSRPNEYYQLGRSTFKLTPWMTGMLDQKHEHHVTSVHTGKDLKIWSRFGEDYLTQYKWFGCPVGIKVPGIKDVRYEVKHGEKEHEYTPQSNIGTWYFVKVENPGSDFTETVDWTKLHHK